MAPQLHVVLLTVCFFVNLSNCFNTNTNVQWYRTARDTADRLTQQPNLTLGTDFASDQVIMFKR